MRKTAKGTQLGICMCDDTNIIWVRASSYFQDDMPMTYSFDEGVLDTSDGTVNMASEMFAEYYARCHTQAVPAAVFVPELYDVDIAHNFAVRSDESIGVLDTPPSSTAAKSTNVSRRRG